MTIKDLIKECDFYDLVKDLSAERADKDNNSKLFAFYKDKYEGLILDILNTKASDTSGKVQSVSSQGSRLNFYISSDLTVKNTVIGSIPWRDLVDTELSIVKKSSAPIERKKYHEIALSIVRDMTKLKFSKK